MKVWDACVLGGGPAGGVAADRLARLGHRVVLLERDPFPRPQVGESLPPSILPLLDALGVRDRVESAGFLRPLGVHVRWGAEPAWRPFGPAPGFQVDRGVFDAILLASARDAGAAVLQPAVALTPSRDGDRWRVPYIENGMVRELRTRAVLDATGRRSRQPRPATGATTIALYGYWSGLEPRDASTLVEAGSDEWYWAAPLPNGTTVAAVFIDSDRCRRDRRTIDALYRQLFAQARLLDGCAGGRIIGTVRACDASCRAAAAPASPMRVAVGDAGLALDPLSSQGVQSAIASALQAAVVVHTMLTRPERTSAAIAFHMQRQREALARHRRIVADSFSAAAQDEAFWRRRRGHVEASPARPRRAVAGAVATRIRLSPDARVDATPVLDGDLVALRPALAHPALERPIAFIDGAPIDALLSAIAAMGTAAATIDAWSRSLAPDRARAALTWLWESGVIVSDAERIGD
jgi:flavin-dependent dehydrogenase